MRVRILLQITTDEGAPGDVEEVASLDKSVERAEDIGLSLAESKALLAAAQQRIVEAQAKNWTEGRRRCEACRRPRRSKGSYPIVFHTLFGDVRLTSPRLRRCPCQEEKGSATASPLMDLIPNHVAPERLYLETRWASLVPYATAAELLADILPVTAGVNATTVRRHVLRVAERVEADLPKDKCSFTEKSPLDLETLPIPDGRVVVGLDGGYVRDGTERKSNFEVIVGRSMPEDGPARYLGFVHGFDRKPQRRNYGERYRSGERISSAFVEATVNAVVSKRFAKKQQMQWTRRGAHLLLQTRTRTLDGTLRSTFERWFPGLANDNSASVIHRTAA